MLEWLQEWDCLRFCREKDRVFVGARMVEVVRLVPILWGGICSVLVDNPLVAAVG